MHASTIILGLAALAAASPNMGPPKPQQTLSATVLSDCPCGDLVTQFASCQSTSSLGMEDCVCNDSWYGSVLACRDCLMLSEGTDLSDSTNFFTNFEQAITNVFTACTEVGGSVSQGEDGDSVCGYANGGDACVHLENGGESWASDEGAKGSYELKLNIKASASETAKSTSKAESSMVTKSKSVSASATKTASATASASAAANGTTSGNATATGLNSTANPSATEDANSGAIGNAAAGWMVIAVAGLVAAVAL
ncbi:hypothetical protein EDC01DRAFT_232918 [Geopyxis carbonaria]|nr:hypothetical protein EDC01DRAFT_232918 [Geopyxis carbonaria]